MSFGLGKNSPVQLGQSKKNLEALIYRQGQWVRWRIAKKCSCVDKNGYHNVHCKKCGGVGDLYDYQKEYEDTFRATARGGIIEIPAEYHNAKITEIYNGHGRRLDFVQYDNFIQITDSDIKNNEQLEAVFRAPLVKRLTNAVLEKAGGGYYRVPGLETEPSSHAGVYYKTSGDVLSVASLKDDEGVDVKVLGYRRDMVLAASNADSLQAHEIDYIMPFRFVILSQELTKEDSEIVIAHKGEAVCTYPYMYNIAEHDVITVLSGSITRKAVMEKRSGGADDIMLDFFVDQIDSIETTGAVFEEGKDFILVGTNKIHWIGNKPQAGEKMSVSYRYLPTYRVVKNLPMLRTSGDQRLPRKAVLALNAAFSEKKGVNRNG